MEEGGRGRGGRLAANTVQRHDYVYGKLVTNTTTCTFSCTIVGCGLVHRVHILAYLSSYLYSVFKKKGVLGCSAHF